MKSLFRLLQFYTLCMFAGVNLGAQTPVLKSRLSLQVGDEVRYYTLSRPEKIDPTFAYPLIVGFHGNRSQVKAWLSDYTRFDQFIPAKKFIIIYPEGPIQWSSSMDGHDLPFFDALVAQLEKDFPIDRQRIYVFGHSNGAGFATFLLFARSDVVAAVAAHSGLFSQRRAGLPQPENKAPLLIFWGENDEMMPAASEPVQLTIKSYERAGFPLESLVLPKWGHSWGGQANQVEEKMLAFFFSHTLGKPSDSAKREAAAETAEKVN